jgi:hypothetical protein
LAESLGEDVLYLAMIAMSEKELRYTAEGQAKMKAAGAEIFGESLIE